jgi:L-ribulose-5-phosphate 4-epimerase
VAIWRRFAELDPDSIPAVLVAGHGPFSWGASAGEAAHNAALLEYVARMASHTMSVNGESGPLQQALLDRHFLRKHGSHATYGQAKAG